MFDNEIKPVVVVRIRMGNDDSVNRSVFPFATRKVQSPAVQCWFW